MNIYEQVTERILTQLEAGIIPWRKEWKVTGHSGLPINYVSKKPYRGINVVLLLSSGFDSDSRFLTYKQAQSIGAQVRKGEKGTQIVFWSTFEGTGKNTAGETIDKQIPFARTYTVFNVSQCDGIPLDLPLDAAPFEPIPAAAALAGDYLQREHIELKHGGNRAFYHRGLDYIQMPDPAAFVSPDAYYSNLFHEAGHSTGAASRLDRVKGDKFADEAYSKEELCAELCAAYLCAQVGISNLQVETNHAAYIQSWMKALKNDKTLLLSAAQKAQRAADCIAGVSLTAAQESAAA
jgi:antirestriction protein ArdC